MLAAGKLRPYHNLYFAFGHIFGDAGDNLCGLVDGKAVIVFRDEICARSAPNAVRCSRKIVSAGLCVSSGFACF